MSDEAHNPSIAGVVYDWPDLADEAPDVGEFVDLSGDPDKLCIRGVVAGQQIGNGVATLTIAIPTDQEGYLELVAWLTEEGELGVQLSDDQEPFEVTEVQKQAVKGYFR